MCLFPFSIKVAKSSNAKACDLKKEKSSGDATIFF
jgi:hypothetical protein